MRTKHPVDGDDEADPQPAVLCDELCAIVDAEVAAGNAVVENWDGWGFGVLLAKPFYLRHPISDRVVFREINDPHYWLAEYGCERTKQVVACRFG